MKEQKKQNRKKSKNNFPRIFRFFTERTFLKEVKYYQCKLVLIGLTSSVIFASIVLVSVDLYKNYQRMAGLNTERMKIEKQIKFWNEVINAHPDYRDGYFELAILEYTLGNFDKSRYFLKKTLLIDPGFGKARELEKML